MPYLATVAAVLGLIAAPALSQTCADEIRLMAEQYGLDATREPPAGAAETPATMESRGTAPGDLRVPDDASGAAGAVDAKRRRMQALLDAARVEEANGSESRCLERLGEARAIPEPG